MPPRLTVQPEQQVCSGTTLSGEKLRIALTLICTLGKVRSLELFQFVVRGCSCRSNFAACGYWLSVVADGWQQKGKRGTIDHSARNTKGTTLHDGGVLYVKVLQTFLSY